MAKNEKMPSREYRIYQLLQIAAGTIQQNYRPLMDVHQHAAARLVSESAAEATALSQEFYNASPEKVRDDNPGIDDCDGERSKSEIDEIKAARKLLRQFDITGVKEPFIPVYEDGYIKFMSFGGVSDNEQCEKFVAWLTKKKLGFKRANERAVTLDRAAQKIVNKIWDSVYK